MNRPAMTARDIRDLFLSYFQEHGHCVVPSAPLVPEHDPTLLFVNSGMVPFKDVFLGKETREYNSAASAQACLRLAGKHNDFNEVGFTQRHHTFFEMLGNFSFGAYFKEPAMRLAWSFLTQYLNLPLERLWVSVYEDDEESFVLWHDVIGVPAGRIVRCGAKDNFWSMGDVGPCGPCTEIFYDHGAELEGGPPGSPDADGPRFMEIWNIVFMQYDRQSDGSLIPLSVPCVDTGMGLERITAVMQGVNDTYDIDMFQRLMGVMVKDVGEVFPLYVKKIVTDHMRASVMLMAQGIFPGPTGRNYVLRRLIRRALRYAYQAGVALPCLARWASEMMDVMADMYPELVGKEERIVSALEEEEQKFSVTLQQGMRLLDRALEGIEGTCIEGALAFKLYDTYGFPVDVTEDILRERGLSLDMAGFEEAMERQKHASRGETVDAVQPFAMNLESMSTRFVYDRMELMSRVLACYDKQQNPVDCLSLGEEGYVVLDQTVCYPEGGGQVGDRGLGLRDQVPVLSITDSQKYGQAIVHAVSVLEAVIQVDDVLCVRVDASRLAIRAHHTATHLLHAALRAVLGPQALQKGSWVDAERLRFDFAWHRPIDDAEIAEIERWVNRAIVSDLPVSIEELPYETAKRSGVLGLFEAQYGQTVRVVSIEGWSQELCGGTHARTTSELGGFSILSTASVASGVRRIEAITAAAALKRFQSLSLWSEALVRELQVSEGAALEKLQSLKVQLNECRDRLAHYDFEARWGVVQQALSAAAPQEPCVVQIEASQAELMQALDRAKMIHPSWVVILGTPHKDSTPMVSACQGASAASTDEWLKKLTACAPARLGAKPGLLRGVFQAVLSAQELQELLLSQ